MINIPKILQNAIFSLLIFAPTALKKTRNRMIYYSLFSKQQAGKSNRQKTSFLKDHGYKLTILVLISFEFFLAACSPIKIPNSNQYRLDSYSKKQFGHHLSRPSILITAPEAAAGYQRSDMLYVEKPFELSSFANNAWVDQPANMLMPLITQSLQRSGYFYTVTSSVNSEHTDYRLDTQLIELQQNFLKKPSQIDFAAEVSLTQVSDNRVVASRLINIHISCPMDTPYGGVIAANRATNLFTAQVSKFVVSQVTKDSHQPRESV